MLWRLVVSPQRLIVKVSSVWNEVKCLIGNIILRRGNRKNIKNYQLGQHERPSYCLVVKFSVVLFCLFVCLFVSTDT